MITHASTSDRGPNPDRFLAALLLAGSVAEKLCRRKGVFGDDAEEFVSWSRLRLIENEYAVLRKFRGESGLETFLSSVIHNHYRDFQNQRFGKWRPSTAAKRLGPLAVALEECVYRDGLAWREAVSTLRHSRFPDLTERAALELLAAMPQRYRRAFVSEARLRHLSSSGSADDALLSAESADQADCARSALRHALDELDPEDRRIVEMRYCQGHTVADIARALRLAQKPLYRRIPRILAELRDDPRLQATRRA